MIDTNRKTVKMGFFDSLFRSGYHVRINGNTFKQDAFVLSLVAFFAVFALPFSFCTLFYMALPQTLRIEEEAMYYLLCSVMGLAMVIMVIMMSCKGCEEWVVRHQQIGQNDDVIPGNPVEDNPRGSRINRYFQKHVTIIGMGIFFVLGLVDDISNAISGVVCLSYFIDCPYPEAADYYMKNRLPYTVFCLMRPLFLGTIFVFCIKFHGKRLKKCAKVRYSLAVVLLAAVSVWLHANMREMDEHSNERHFDQVPVEGNGDFISDNDNGSIPSAQCYGPQAMECIAETTPIQKFTKSIFSFIYPLHIEMTFLVIELLAHLTSLLTVPERQNDNFQDPENMRLLQHVNGYHHNIQDGIPANANYSCFSIFHCLVIIIVTIIGAVHVIMSLFTRWDNNTPEYEDKFKYRQMYNSEQLMFYCIMFITSIFSFALSANFRSVYTDPGQHKYDGLELMFLLSSFVLFYGLFMQEIAYYFSLKGTTPVTTNVSNVEPHEPLPGHDFILTMVVANIIDFLTVYPITVLVLHAGRVQALHEGGTREKCFKLSLLVLSILNFANWLAFGFLESGNPHIDPVADYYFCVSSQTFSSNWDRINYFINPLCLFYRFTAAILLLKIYLK